LTTTNSTPLPSPLRPPSTCQQKCRPKQQPNSTHLEVERLQLDAVLLLLLQILLNPLHILNQLSVVDARAALALGGALGVGHAHLAGTGEVEGKEGEWGRQEGKEGTKLLQGICLGSRRQRASSVCVL